MSRASIPLKSCRCRSSVSSRISDPRMTKEARRSPAAQVEGFPAAYEALYQQNSEWREICNHSNIRGVHWCTRCCMHKHQGGEAVHRSTRGKGFKRQMRYFINSFRSMTVSAYDVSRYYRYNHFIMGTFHTPDRSDRSRSRSCTDLDPNLSLWSVRAGSVQYRSNPGHIFYIMQVLYGSHPAAWARSCRSYRSCRSGIYLPWNN